MQDAKDDDRVGEGPIDRHVWKSADNQFASVGHTPVAAQPRVSFEQCHIGQDAVHNPLARGLIVSRDPLGNSDEIGAGLFGPNELPGRANGPIHRGDYRVMFYQPPSLEIGNASLDGLHEPLLTGDIGPQCLLDEQRLRATGRPRKLGELRVENFVDIGRDGH